MSIGRVIFTSRQNSKPPFLCQYLIFFNDFFFTLEISFGSLLKPKNRNLKKIADLKVYRNLKLRILGQYDEGQHILFKITQLLSASCRARLKATHLWRQIRSLETQNVSYFFLPFTT